MSGNKRIVFLGPGRVTKFLQVDNRGTLSDLKLAFAHYGRDTLKTRILSAVRDFVKLV